MVEQERSGEGDRQGGSETTISSRISGNVVLQDNLVYPLYNLFTMCPFGVSKWPFFGKLPRHS